MVPSIHWGALSPILVLFGAALLAITLSSFIGGAKKNLIGQIFGAVGGLGSLAACWILWVKVDSEGPILTLADTVRVDHMGLFITGIIGASVFLCSVCLSDFFKKEKLLGLNEVFVLLILSGAGGAIMATSNDLIILFMGLEVLSLSAYILAASHIRQTKSQESGMKYFVIGAFASGFFLYGIALIYGATGSLKLAEISDAITAGGADRGFLLGGIALFLVGLLFKIAAVPFHSWAPDVYEGSPSPVVAFMVSAVKVAGFSALIRVLGGALIESAADWQPIIYAVAIASMAAGTLAAIVQTNVKRILAYSSIAHAGYILVGIQSGTESGFASSLWYLAAYAILALGSFVIVSVTVGASSHNGTNGNSGINASDDSNAKTNNSDDPHHVDNFTGLATRQPFVAVIFSVLLFAQAGIPPTSGFYAKFLVISAAVETRSYPLAITAMAIAVAGAFIYIRLMVVMFFTKSTDSNAETTADQKSTPKTDEKVMAKTARKTVPITIKGVLLITAIFTIAAGVYPGPLQNMTISAAQMLV